MESFIEKQNCSKDIFFGTNNSILDQLKRISLFSENIECSDVLNLQTYTNPITFLFPNGENNLKQYLSLPQYSEFLKNGILFNYQFNNYYFDKYQWNSIPLIKKDNESISCSARITLHTEVGTILKNTKNTNIYPEYRDLLNNTAELSQVKIDKSIKDADILSFFTDIQTFNQRLLHNNKLLSPLNLDNYNLLKNKLNINIIGEAFNYLGNIHYPALINLT